MPVVASVVVTILMQWAIQVLVPTTAYVYRLFRPPGEGGWMMSLVPAVIVFLLVWTLTDLVQKHRAGSKNENDLAHRNIKQLPNLIAQEPLSVLVARLLTMDTTRSVARRILWLLHYLETNADAQRTHELLRHQSDLDADTAAARYRTVKLFIWAMPILGFVGTVLGISLAVGGFSEFLTGSVNVDEIDSVTAELGKVAGGLSFAFDTTLLGLLAGLIANITASGVQKRDERFLTALDELGLSIVANSQAPGALALSSQAIAQGDPGETFDHMMQTRLEQLSAQMDSFTEAVQIGLDGFLDQWSKLPPEVERVAAELGGLREHLATATANTDEMISGTRLLIEGLDETSSRMSAGLTESIGSVSRTVETLGENVEAVAEALARTMAGLSDRVTSSESHLASGLASLEDTLDRTNQQSAASAASQASVERAVRQLAESVTDFGERLLEFKDAQSALAPVLNRLAGPLELRLVSAPVPELGASGTDTKPVEANE